MIAGPTELLVYADSNADPKLVALDLISQAEHSYDTFCGLVTNYKELAVQVTNNIRVHPRKKHYHACRNSQEKPARKRIYCNL